MPHGETVSPTPAIIDALPPGPGPKRGAILIVEDRDDVRQGLSQLLEFQGYLVFEAADAAEASAHLESSPSGIALILLDLNLPGMGGADLRATQLANPLLSNIPTIVVSASAPDVAGGAELRAAAWLEKPFRFEQLLEAVRRFVTAEVGVTDVKTALPDSPTDE